MIHNADPSASEKILAQWNFDDVAYLRTTLLDAGEFKVDLRLLDGATLVPSARGQLLRLDESPVPAVELASDPQLFNSASYPDRLAAADPPEVLNIGDLSWRFEVDLRVRTRPASAVPIFYLSRHGIDTVPAAANQISLGASGQSIELYSEVANHTVELSSYIDIADGEWHSIVVSFDANVARSSLQVDGELQSEADGALLPLQGELEHFAIGREPNGSRPLVADLARVILVAIVPTFLEGSAVDLPVAPERGGALPQASPLRFSPAPTKAIDLGVEPHLLIDGAILARPEKARFVPHRPTVERLDFVSRFPWEAAPRVGPRLPDILGLLDDGEKLRMYYSNMGLWGGKPTTTSVAYSDDGVSWFRPNVGLHSWPGFANTNIVLTDPVQGTVFLDPLGAQSGKPFSLLAYGLQRGIVAYRSRDGLRWERCSALTLPFDCGGGVEAFYDEQRKEYMAYLRHEGYLLGFEEGRAVALASSPQLEGPWPFTRREDPKIRSEFMSLPTPTDELPVVMQPNHLGEIYRSQAVKYSWAPDTYLAFPWRHRQDTNRRDTADLCISRDGVTWATVGDQPYFSIDDVPDGVSAAEVMLVHGLVRRGDEVLQLAMSRGTGHGGPEYRGEELHGGHADTLLLLRQPLHRIVGLCIDGREPTLTKSLRISARHLNVDCVPEKLRVEVLHADGEPRIGFSGPHAGTVRRHGDGHRVEWQDRGDLAELVGEEAILSFSGAAIVYSVQFSDDS